ncbi:cobalamin-5'-phosphate synthase [Desulfonatronum thiosulfatophilum]|uniref:Adenosylcobinamide-GDP ribazoletransferase n=1 Tax=Desulfonatronum thiosulfatophilum TaxID=617002 RepID=A0A1G6CSJ5_9BACT|nr:adenosylcobinamide-GDP ribazoletransferase [Desulfonatronum thiosulfatophilum]SDB35856.1 cobalamin-5'-phosphate synthase [Desulfonatronum thiosulfatophilum]
MPKLVKEFFLAAGFLTRWAPAMIADNDELGRSMRWFPVVGLVLGIVLVLPLVLGLAAGRPWVQAWIWLGFAMYITRGLHWDGWADLGDAWGSGARGERFWEVIKDSRMGAFGGMGLFMGLAGCLIMVQGVVEAGQWGMLIWAPVLGRSAAVLLAWQARDLHRPGLAGLFLNALTWQSLAFVTSQAVVFGLFFVPWSMLLLAAGLCLGGILVLVRIARAQGGLNGDFLGTAIVWGEMSVFAAWMIGG